MIMNLKQLHTVAGVSWWVFSILRLYTVKITTPASFSHFLPHLKRARRLTNITHACFQLFVFPNPGDDVRSVNKNHSGMILL